MIKLEDININELDKCIKPTTLQKMWEEERKGKIKNTLQELYKIIEQKNLSSIQELINEIEETKEIDWTQVLYELNDLKTSVDKHNKKEKEPTIYQTKRYEDSSLYRTDSLNYGNILLLPDDPDKIKSQMSICIKPINILKKELSQCTIDGKNYFNTYTRKIGAPSIPKIVDSIDMYTDQVLRQSQLTNQRDINLFTYQQDQKREIVTDKYAEIIAYFLQNTKEFIWSKLKETQKKDYLSSIINKKYSDKVLKKKMIKRITNYTTLKELENMEKEDYKVLQRFIKK